MFHIHIDWGSFALGGVATLIVGVVLILAFQVGMMDITREH